MKLLIFAHTPPPYHGQSIAVKLLLERFGGDRRKPKLRRLPPNHYGIECYHVNARFSKSLEDVGELQAGKTILLLFYCLQAIWCRFRYGVENFFYIPAPGKPVALYRDWLVMLVCRPFFKTLIFNWRAAGLAKWLETTAGQRTRGTTFKRMGYADASIVLSEFSRNDAEKLMARRVMVVAGGIADPCPEFDIEILPLRRTRLLERKRILSGGVPVQNDANRTVNVVFIGHCTREKGAFDSVAGIALANEKLAAEGFPLRFKLTLIGAFTSPDEEKALRELVRARGLQDAVIILGFASNERKIQELRNADLFCFPSYYLAEGQPASLIEAMAFGLPVIATRWRAIPDMFPEDYPGLVDTKAPDQIAGKLRELCVSDLIGLLRETYVRRFTLERHMDAMAQAIGSVENA
jgi:glycosyltransferase involved in cell wall biosynthesis